MKKLAMVVGSIVGLGLLFFAIVVAINALDEPLAPAAQSLVKQSELEVKPSEGYDYLLGLTATADQDPLAAGRMIRERFQAMRSSNSIGRRFSSSEKPLRVTSQSKKCEGIASRPVFCGEEWYRAHAVEIETVAKENAVLLSRYDKLMTFASLNTDPSSRNLVDSNVFDVQHLLQIKQEIWGAKWTKGNKEEVIKEWTESNRFFNRWLEATPISMTEATIVLHLLEFQKSFALEVLKSDPKAVNYFNSDNLLTLKPTISFDRLKNKVAVSELNFFHAIASKSPNIGSLLDAGLGDGTRDSSSVLYKLPVPLLKWNATLNEFTERVLKAQNEPCVTNANPCEGSAPKLVFTFINPIGKYLVTALNPSSAVYEKMYQRYSNLSGF